MSINSTLWIESGNVNSLSLIYFIKKKLSIKVNSKLIGSGRILSMTNGYRLVDTDIVGDLKPTTISYSLKQPSVVMNAELEMI